MKGHRALSPAAPVLMALVALPAQVGSLVLQEILECFNPGQQTEGLKAALNLLEFTASRCSVAEPSATTDVVSRIVFVTGVAPLCNSSPGIDMTAEVFMRLGKRWGSRCGGSGRRATWL
jgi:hypothetical protein